MDNHLHLLVRIESDVIKKWSDEEVVKRWLMIYPPRSFRLDDELSVQKWVSLFAQDKSKVAVWRDRLANLGWFMKALKEPLARMANKEDDCHGTFWESRYKSIAILDEEALLMTCAYIDLNPVAAGIASTPEESSFTSIRQRVFHLETKGKLGALSSVEKGSVLASNVIGNVEQDHWLIPIEDRRPFSRCINPSTREGLIEKFTIGNYLHLVDHVSRLFRDGKARVGAHLRSIFDRLNSSFAILTDRLKDMLGTRKLRGRCFAGSSAGVPPEVKALLGARAMNLRCQNSS